METQEVAVVLLADLVAGQDDDILRVIAVDEGNILVDGIGCAFVPVGAGRLLIRGQYMDAAVQTVQVPGLAVADVLIQHKRLVLGQNPHRVNVGIDTVGQREIDDAVLAAKRHSRLGQLLGQRIQA